MKRRHRAKSDIVIDLTSLLDVVFIVLLVVICRQHILTDSQQEKMGDVEAREALAQEKYELYMDQLETADQLNQYVWAVSVYARYSSEKVTERHISVLREGQEIRLKAYEHKINVFDAKTTLSVIDGVKHYED